MALEFFSGLLLYVLFATQYFINKKRGAVEQKPKESIPVAAAFALLPLVMVVLVLTRNVDKIPYLVIILRCIVLVLATIWFVQSFSRIKSLLQKQE